MVSTQPETFPFDPKPLWLHSLPKDTCLSLHSRNTSEHPWQIPGWRQWKSQVQRSSEPLSAPTAGQQWLRCSDRGKIECIVWYLSVESVSFPCWKKNAHCVFIHRCFAKESTNNVPIKYQQRSSKIFCRKILFVMHVFKLICTRIFKFAFINNQRNSHLLVH